MSDAKPPVIKMVPIEDLHPAPWNPRVITEERFKNLQAAMTADPGFLALRPILARLDGEIFAGNMRYRAAVALGHQTVAAIVEDVDDATAKARAVRDNEQWGEWEDTSLAELLTGMSAEGADLALLGLSDRELEALVGIGTAQVAPDPQATWTRCPRCGTTFDPAKAQVAAAQE